MFLQVKCHDMILSYGVMGKLLTSLIEWLIKTAMNNLELPSVGYRGAPGEPGDAGGQGETGDAGYFNIEIKGGKGVRGPAGDQGEEHRLYCSRMALGLTNNNVH
jgi:hypothetical protein